MINPNEFPAAHCKVIALIQVGKFNDALQLIERNKLTQLLFERAYCEYRLNQPDKALRTIDKGDKPLAASLKELRAQVLYRLEQFDECFDAYKDIIKNTNDDYEDERATNLSAAAANLAVIGSVIALFYYHLSVYLFIYSMHIDKRRFEFTRRHLRVVVQWGVCVGRSR